MPPMPTYSIRDFRAHLRAALAQLADGPVCVAGWGQRPVAYLVSAADWAKLQPGSAPPVTPPPAAGWQSSDRAGEPPARWQIGATAPGSR